MVSDATTLALTNIWTTESSSALLGLLQLSIGTAVGLLIVLGGTTTAIGSKWQSWYRVQHSNPSQVHRLLPPCPSAGKGMIIPCLRLK